MSKNPRKPRESAGIQWMVIDSNVFAYAAYPHQFKVIFYPTESRLELFHGEEVVGKDYKTFQELDSATRRIIIDDLNNPRGA